MHIWLFSSSLILICCTGCTQSQPCEMNYECDSGRCCVATWTCATEKVCPCYNNSDCKDGEACYYHDISRAFCDLKSLQPTITTPKPSSYNHPRVTIDYNRYCLSDSECEEEEPCQDGQCAYNEDDSSLYAPMGVCTRSSNRFFFFNCLCINVGEGTGGRGTERKGGRRCTGGGRRWGGKRESQNGGKREKKGKITQHCAILCNRKNAKRRGPTNTGREAGGLNPPVPPNINALFCKTFTTLGARVVGSTRTSTAVTTLGLWIYYEWSRRDPIFILGRKAVGICCWRRHRYRSGNLWFFATPGWPSAIQLSRNGGRGNRIVMMIYQNISHQATKRLTGVLQWLHSLTE